MKLLKVELENFRQFYDVCVIEFSVSTDKPITLIHGENGLGKTTLLNAILWCFYGQFTDDFEKKDQVINSFQLKNGKAASARVSVFFNDNNTVYCATRNYDEKLKSSTLSVFEVDNGNFSRKITPPTHFIESIMPREMAKYFFFHGEDLSSINKANDSNKFRTSIRDILGCTSAEYALEDLELLKNELNDELIKLNQKNKKYSDSLKKKKELENELANNSSKKQYFIDSIKSLVDEHSILTLKLKEINKFDVRQFIQKKESLNGERKVLELKKIKYEEDKVKLIKNYSLGLFGHDLSQQVIEELNDKDKLGSLPAPYDESLINQLEEAGSCICGRELIKGTKPYEAVLALRNKADNAEIKHRRLKAVHFAGSLKRKPSEFISEYNRVFDGLKSARSRIVEIDAEISEVEKMILSSPDDEIRKTQAEIKSREQRISDLKHKEVQIESLRPRMEAQLAELKKDISRYQPDDKFNSDIHRKIEFIKRLKKTCSLKLEQHEKDAVKEIAKKVNETLDKFSRKDFKIRLSTDYQFFLTKADGEPLAKSKGENLLLNLSFISSLISFCKQRVSAEGNFLIKGTVAPFFIDAPFGELDETYREATAQFLPESCEQLILLLSSSHWKGKVSSAIDSKIGKEYVLVSHKTYDKGEKPDDTIDIKGLKVNQSVYNSKFDGTVVEIV